MSLKLSTKKARRYNARQLKKWHAKNQAFTAYKIRLQEVLNSQLAKVPKKGVVAIDLDGIQSVEDFYQRLAAKVDLPTHTAINLDALHDVLLGDVAEPLTFRWKAVTEDVLRDPDALGGLKTMLEDLPQARTDISISYKGCSN